MVHSTLEFLISHNVGIIQTLFGVLFLLLIFLILRSFKEDSPSQAKTVYVEKSKSKSSAKAASQPTSEAKAGAPQMPVEASPLDDLDNLDDLVGADEKGALTLDPSKPASSADAPAASSAAATAGANNSAVSLEQKAELDKALSEKEKIIVDLKAEISNLQQKANAAPPAADASELESKLKELTDKLTEYEIIEEDIANLSFYKNENTKLKDELEKMRASGGAAPTSAPSAPETVVAASAPAPAAPEAPVAASEPDLSQLNPGDVVSVQPEIEPPPAQPTPTDAAAMDEFEKIVQQKEALEQTMPTQTSSAPAIDADILKEFENVVQKEWGGGASAAAPEAAPTPAPEPVAAPEPTPESTASAPEAAPAAEEIDTNKLLSEVEELAKTEVKEESAPENEEESKQKLIAEFENFINKAQ